ncbi:MAG: exopolyphosphatase, partial [Desulfococcaceae bacterium]
MSLDQVLHPEDHPYILLSMTISNPEGGDEAYWNRVVDLLRHSDIHTILADPLVRDRCEEAVSRNRAFRDILLRHTRMEGHVSITDFREYDEAPRGNRFLVYSLFPDAVVSVKIRNADADRDRVIISVGHSIFNRNCNVNVGL